LLRLTRYSKNSIIHTYTKKEHTMNDTYDWDLDAGEDFAYTVTGCDPEEYLYEDDGQPDEAQEWHDFDPDC